MGKMRLLVLLWLFYIYNIFILRGSCIVVNIYGFVFLFVLVKIFKIYDDGYFFFIKIVK